jgi:endonuclease-3 related protein
MKDLTRIFEKLLAAYGPQHWWPGDTPFEVAVGAILTQNTNWGNVERAIANLRRARALSARRMHAIPVSELAELIRPSGYYNVKAARLRNFVSHLVARHGGSMARMGRGETAALRAELLSIGGIGPETADSILLYALQKPVFVIDAYTKRILSRHGVIAYDEAYGVVQALFEGALPRDVALYNEYHALLVMAGKTHCRPSKPLCDVCPLHGPG